MLNYSGYAMFQIALNLENHSILQALSSKLQARNCNYWGTKYPLPYK